VVRTSRPGRARRGLLGAAAVVALLVAGCGSGRSSADADPSGGDTTAVAGSTGFGDLASPCGPGQASGATQQGVTDTSITIGYGDDAGFAQSPGLDHEVSDAVRAMIGWCNAQGGIGGREVVGDYHDAKVLDVNNAMAEACARDFMLVGQGWSLDSSQETTRLGCRMATVPAFATSPAFAHGELMVQPVPNPVDLASVEIAAALQAQFPEEVTKAAVMFGNYASTIDTKDKVLASYPQFGFTFLDCPQEYNIAGESDWKPFVQRLQDCGAEAVYFTGSPYPFFENVLDAAAQIGYHPVWITDANFYDQQFAAWNVAGNADRTYVRTTFVPLEEADASPATAQYVDLVETSGGDVSQLGEQAASAFLLWATAAQACGSQLTSTCVMDHLAQVHSWTGGGLHAETDPGANLPTDCGIVLRLDGTSFVRDHPEGAGTYDCDPSYVVPVTGRVVDQANLDADRVSRPG
jgi:ABC-type branched-subunit amino acid transport system substrate-binding protein